MSDKQILLCSYISLALCLFTFVFMIQLGVKIAAPGWGVAAIVNLALITTVTRKKK